MSSPQICPFFLKGNCRYGNKCRLSHNAQGGSGGSSQSNRSGGGQSTQSRHSGPQQPSNGSRTPYQSQGSNGNPRGRPQQNGSSQSGYSEPQSRYQDSSAHKADRRGNQQSNTSGYGRDNRGQQPNGRQQNQTQNSSRSGIQGQRQPYTPSRNQGRGYSNEQGAQDDAQPSYSGGRNSNRPNQAPPRGQSQSTYQNRGQYNDSSYQHQQHDDESGFQAHSTQQGPNRGQSHYQQGQSDYSQQQYQPQHRQNQQYGRQSLGNEYATSQSDPRRNRGYAQDSSSSHSATQYDADYGTNYNLQERGYQQRGSGNGDFQQGGRYGEQSHFSGQRPNQRNSQQTGQSSYGRQGSGYGDGNQGRSTSRRSGYSDGPEDMYVDDQYQTQQIVLQYQGLNSDGRAWYTRGDGSRLTEVQSPNHQYGGRMHSSQYGQGVGYGGFDASTSMMQVDGDGNFENENSTPLASASSSTNPDHGPSPLYASYYTKAETIPNEQLSLFQDSEFGSELPEAPPPFEQCYAPGEVPKQFAPKSHH